MSEELSRADLAEGSAIGHLLPVFDQAATSRLVGAAMRTCNLTPLANVDA
jgi:hypothetical protein